MLLDLFQLIHELGSLDLPNLVDIVNLHAYVLHMTFVEKDNQIYCNHHNYHNMVHENLTLSANHSKNYFLCPYSLRRETYSKNLHQFDLFLHVVYHDFDQNYLHEHPNLLH